MAAKTDEEAAAVEEEREPPVLLVTLVHYILHSIFFILKSKSTISKFTTPMVFMRTNLTFPTTPKRLSLNTKEFCTARGTIMKDCL